MIEVLKTSPNPVAHGVGTTSPRQGRLKPTASSACSVSAGVGGCWGPERPSPVTLVSSAPCMRFGCHAKTAWMQCRHGKRKVVATW